LNIQVLRQSIEGAESDPNSPDKLKDKAIREKKAQHENEIKKINMQMSQITTSKPCKKINMQSGGDDVFANIFLPTSKTQIAEQLRL
jgi:hypothetical protein